MIVVFSYPGDPHANAVTAQLAADGHPHVVIDWSDFPEQASLTVELACDAAPRLVMRHATLGEVDLSACTAAWWRRPQAPRPDRVVDPAAATFALSEWAELTAGAQALLPARWMNDPVADAAASRKLLQLRLAAACGLTIPATLATTDPFEARQFVQGDTHGESTVSKTFLATRQIWRPTSIVTEDLAAQLDQVSVCPVIFQRYVPGVDLRVTVVGKQLFTTEIDATQTDSPADFRPVLGAARVTPGSLPAAVERALLGLMARLGLEYGACDLRRRPDGEHVFLEINTAGEFLFCEQLAGHRITQAVADFLAGAQSPAASVRRRNASPARLSRVDGESPVDGAERSTTGAVRSP